MYRMQVVLAIKGNHDCLLENIDLVMFLPVVLPLRVALLLLATTSRTPANIRLLEMPLDHPRGDVNLDEAPDVILSKPLLQLGK